MRHDGDEQGATEFISRNLGLMKRIAVRRLSRLGHPDPPYYADDVVAVASAKVVLNWAGWHSPMGAMIRITRNEATTFVRKHFRRRETDLTSIEGAGTHNGDPGCAPDQLFERAALLEFAMKVLNERERALLKLRYYGMEFAEIAAEVGISVGTLTSIYTRALKKMRKAPEAAQASSRLEPASDSEEKNVGRGGLRHPVTTEG